MMNSATKNQKLFPRTSVFAATALALALSPAAFAGKGHKAHEHGVANVNVVGEGNTVTIQLQAPSDSIYGFEHEAKKEADVKKRDTAIEKLRTSAEQMFVLDPSLGCKITSNDIKPFVTESNEQKDAKSQAKADKHKEGTHSEVHATFKFECSKPVAGSKLSFAARKHFKSLRTLKIQVLSGEKQDGTTIKNDKGTVSL
jgi:hypothetical protein